MTTRNSTIGTRRGVKATILATLLATGMALGACDGFKDEPRTATQTSSSGKQATAGGKPQKAGKSMNQPVEDAMMSIPPEMRASYQQAFICEVKREKAKNKAVQVTPAYVQDLTGRLKADPGLAKC